MNWLRSMPNWAQYCQKNFSTSSKVKASLPAGTGVCVVKMELARTASAASVKDRPAPCTSSRTRSKPRKALWPSFMCQMAGE